MPGSLPPLQLAGDPAVQQNFDAILRAWEPEPVYRGSGSPAGVVTAGPGAEYIDLSTGRRWTHVATTTSATGWVVDNPSFTRGVATITMTVSASGSSANVAHGLGATPVAITATARPTADTREDYLIVTRSRDATNIVFGIRITAYEHFGMVNGTVITFDWIASL